MPCLKDVEYIAHLFQTKVARLQIQYLYRYLGKRVPELLVIEVNSQKGLICPSYPIQDESWQEDQIGLNESFHQGRDKSVAAAYMSRQHRDDQEGIARFYGPCMQSACGHWSKNHCQLGESVSKVRVVMKRGTSSCPIKKSCRWLLENGPSVCEGCAHIDYNLRLTQKISGQSN